MIDFLANRVLSAVCFYIFAVSLRRHLTVPEILILMSTLDDLNFLNKFDVFWGLELVLVVRSCAVLRVPPNHSVARLPFWYNIPI